MQRTNRFLLIVALAALPFAAAMVYGLTAVFGAPAIGVKCSRLDGLAQCEVQQSAFFGLAGNSVRVIPESEIAGARTARPAGGAGRRGGGYTLLLDLKSGRYRYYPVLSGQSFDAVEADSRKLTSYLTDPRATSIELRENLRLSVLTPLFSVVLVLGIAAVAGLAGRRRDSSQPGIAD